MARRFSWILAIFSVLLLSTLKVATYAADSSSSVVQIVNGKTPGSLEVRATQKVQLAPELNVERLLESGAFEPVSNLDLGSMKLVTRCGQHLGKNVEIDERGLRPVPWTGMSCSSQCNHTCRANIPMSGKFRFVIWTADRKTRFEGPVFTLKTMP